MEKVWFKLRQTHYPPPPEESILKGVDGNDAPIRLGHFISSLQRIDNVLNFESVQKFSPSMRVFPTRMVNFNWEQQQKRENGGNLGASAPIAAAAGVTVGANVQAAFKRSLANYEEYKALDTYIVQPTQSYVNACMNTAPLNDHKGGWLHTTVFMITGLCVARLGTSKRTETQGVDVGFNVTADVPTIASANAGMQHANDQSTIVGGQHTTEFVFAVRLAKVHKGVLSTDWSVETHTDKATFSSGDDEVDVADVVHNEGVPLDAFQVVEDQELDCAFVM